MLKKITESTHDILIDMRYATPNNFVGKAFYEQATCYLHEDALPYLDKAIVLAREHELKLKIFDAYRSQAAQENLWALFPDPMYIAPPTLGSNHTRGIALDLTLVDKRGQELDMGTGFDTFTPLSHHGTPGLSKQATANRYLLLAIMISAGWNLYRTEWWHYQLFNEDKYPLIKKFPPNS